MKTKIWLIAASLILIGGVVFVGIMTKLGWDFTKLSTRKFETNTYEIRESFRNISIDTDTADITFALSKDGKCSVECYERKKETHRVTVANGALSIALVDERAWYDYIGFHFGTPKITVYLPETQYNALCVENDTGDISVAKEFVFGSVDISQDTGDVSFFAGSTDTVKIQTSTGDIRIENTQVGGLVLSVSTGDIRVSDVSCGDIEADVSTGDVLLNNVQCKNVTSTGDTGDITLKNVLASQRFTIERCTGDVKFDASDAAEIFVQTDTGDIKGSLLTDKVFIARTDTGNIRVPKTIVGGRCELSTDTGNIEITVR